jgi:gliding motility-associatede transport system auxiliary component
MQGPARRFWSSAVAVVAVAAIAIGINLFVDQRFANVHLDLTAGRIYTLSKGTREILAELKQPITLRLYYSRALGARLPLYGEYADRVEAMLREYAARAHGMIRLEFYDPLPFSRVEDQALGYGLTGVPLDQQGTKVYFGLAGTNLIDTEQTIPFFDFSRSPFLQYDLTRLVDQLAHPKPPVIGVMSSLPLNGNPRLMMAGQGQPGQPGGPWMSMLELEKDFHVEQVPLDAQVIDPKIRVLLVAQAQNLSKPTLYAIDQFVMRGGRLMVIVDPYSDAESNIPGPEGAPSVDDSSTLEPLLSDWGLAYNENQVVCDLTGAVNVQAGNSDQVAAVPYVAWFNIRDGISKADPATADLSQVTVATPGFIAKKSGAHITFTPLLESSSQSEVVPVKEVSLNPDPAKLIADFRPAGGPRVIAARVRGMLHSAFTGPPELPAGIKRAANLPPYIAETKKPANLIVVADSDILADRFWVQVQNFFGQPEAIPFSDNGAFVSNLVGSLAGGDLLLSLRGRGMVSRPFTLIEGMQASAQARFRRTELALQAKLRQTQEKLAALRQGTASGGGKGADASTAILTPEQSRAIAAAEQEIVQTREQLRQVEFDLDRNISHLETELRIFCVVLVPALLVLIAIGLGLVRRHRRRISRA